jgi:predicted TPR repeat methyltransferase
MTPEDAQRPAAARSDQLIRTAIAHQRAGRLAEAAVLYRQVLADEPDNVNALNLLGVILNERGESDAAAELIGRAVVQRPASAAFRINWGVSLATSGHFEAALEQFRAALRLKPADPTAHRNLGNLLYKKGDGAGAERHFRQAIAAQLGDGAAHLGLAFALKAQGRIDAAAEAARAALALTPENAEIRFLLAALEQTAVPDCPPAAYVRGLFDTYAGSFDRDLENLGYRTPADLRAMLDDVLPPNGGPLDILDLGCGTGKGGFAMKDRARRLVGIDLSPRMIAEARARGIYDELIAGDILTVSAALETSSFDLVLAADVFIYVGDIAPAMGQIARLLRPGGHAAFSTETMAGMGYCLDITLRYVHTPGYVRDTVTAAGLALRAHRQVELRRERERTVVGDLFLVARGA